MAKMKVIGAVVLCLTLVLGAVAQAEDSASSSEEKTVGLDEVVLKNGSRILGTVTSARDGTIVIETDFSDPISIDTKEIDAVHTQGSMVVLMDDGSTIRDQPIDIDDSGIVVTADDGRQRAYSVSDFKILNPEPW